MVRVTLSETYDLSTKVNKMSMVGIHTPTMNLVRKSYPGMVLNHRFCKFLKCDVRLACASILPADPLQVGVEAGDIAPQDMFNPILYKAVSNQGMSNFVARMHCMNLPGVTNVISGESVDAIDDGVDSNDDAPDNDFSMYYTLLANHKGFKIAHPQNGLRMSSLRPFVYERYYDNGENGVLPESGGMYANPTYPVIGGITASESNYQPVTANVRHSMFGKAHPMPRFNTTFFQNLEEQEVMSDGLLGVGPTAVMPIYCGLILLPPAKLNVLYYRLVVRWTIEFSGIRPIQEIEVFNQLAADVGTFYGTDYAFASKDMSYKLNLVDTKDADIEKIMEGA